MNLNEISITDLIPQRPPFVMVDRVVSCDNTIALTEFKVRNDNIFLDNGTLAPAGLIENMAQSCAARMGCINLLHNEPIKIGVIGEIRNCEINRLPVCDDILKTKIVIIEDIMNLVLAEISVEVNGEVIANTRMKVALTGDASIEK